MFIEVKPSRRKEEKFDLDDFFTYWTRVTWSDVDKLKELEIERQEYMMYSDY